MLLANAWRDWRTALIEEDVIAFREVGGLHHRLRTTRRLT
jgi:hypothetical protein